MPLYNWKCDKCLELTEVKRAMVDIDLPPEKCDHCSNPSFQDRVTIPTPGVKQFMLIDGGVGWPSHGFYSKLPERKQ